MRVRLWFIILLFAGVLLVGLISLPFGIFLPWDDVFGDGGIADNLLNVFAYGLLFFLIILPVGLMGAMLIWQPRGGDGPRQRYILWKLALGALLLWVAYALVREVVTSETPFPTSREDAERRAAEP